ncbi:MAG: hypothetical protein CMP61_07840 [Flavobacteriales bacterium]|nr:hypothetical protein [Flavobacteriales bacterium]|tara:strand:+ start:24913 stop:25677 length:765 start_codon:yes stop_codon:yes gene_type:complete
MKKVANTFLIISSVLIFTGFLFKNMHWPGGTISLILGTVLSLFGMLFYFIARYKNKYNVKIATYSVYFYFFVMVIGTGYYSAIGASRDLLNSFHEVNVRIEKSNESLLDLISNHNSEGMLLYNDIEKHKLALMCGGEMSTTLISKEEVMNRYCANGIPLYKANQDIAALYFLIDGTGEELVKSLKKVRKDYALALGHDFNLMESFEESVSPYEVDGPNVTWINSLCEHLPMIAVLPKLSSVQNQILHCELALQK